MTPELTVLALAGLLQAVHFVLYAVRANLDVGPGYTMSARDRAPSRDLSELGGRLQRAMNNHSEGLILFSLAVVVVTLSDQSTSFTATCAYIYLAARVVYIPAYVFAWRPGRSIIWSAGFLATILMIVSALF